MSYRKSSHSINDGNCVEVDGEVVDYRKSSRSISNGCCVEVGSNTRILIRDTADRHGVTLAVPAGAWMEFLDSLR